METPDHAFLDYCTLLDQYMELMCQLNDAMRDGFFHLAKAQYTMGHDAVSPLMFDMKMSALRTVSLSSDTDSRVTVASHCQSPASHKEDPLYWYGALPCPALRTAQTSFSSAADLVALLAQLRMNMATASATFSTLTEHK